MGRSPETAATTHHWLPKTAGEPHEAVSRWDGMWKRGRGGGRFMWTEWGNTMLQAFFYFVLSLACSFATEKLAIKKYDGDEGVDTQLE